MIGHVISDLLGFIAVLSFSAYKSFLARIRIQSQLDIIPRRDNCFIELTRKNMPQRHALQPALIHVAIEAIQKFTNSCSGTPIMPQRHALQPAPIRVAIDAIQKSTNSCLGTPHLRGLGHSFFKMLIISRDISLRWNGYIIDQISIDI